MPVITDFTIGKQHTLVLVANGAIVGTANIVEFMAKQTVIKLKVRPTNQRPIHKNLPDGWSGTLTLDRIDSTLDDYFANAENDYWNGVVQPSIYISETITENDGSVSQYRYDGVTLEFSDTGTYKADDKVTQKVEFEATARRPVAS